MLEPLAWLKARFGNERGQDMVEHAMVTVVLAVAVVMATLMLLSPALTAWAHGLADCVSRPSGYSCFP